MKFWLLVGRSGELQCLEKDSQRELLVAVPQTDTGGLVEYTKASGRRWFKELGKKAGRKLCKMPCPEQSGSQKKITSRLFN